MDYEYLINESLFLISVDQNDHSLRITSGKNAFDVEPVIISPNEILLIVDGRTVPVYMARDGDRIVVQIQGRQFEIREPAEDGFQAEETKSREDMRLVKSPMPGKVIKIEVETNQDVRKNQTLVVVEAMKMENEIKAALDGRVKKIFVSEGELVDAEIPLIELTE